MRALIETEVHRKQAIDYLSRIKLSATAKYVVEIKQWRRMRTVRQNKLLWMWMHAIAAETGHTPEEMHAYYKQLFLSTVVVKDVNGDEVRVAAGTSTLNTEEFNKYLERVNQHALDFHNCALPWPDTFGWDSLVAMYGGV